MPRRPDSPRKFRVQVYYNAEEHALVRELALNTGADMSTAVRMLTKMGADVMARSAEKKGSTGE